MPRNVAGVYTLPNSPVVNGTTIDPVDENQTRDDLANELTNSLDRNGRGGMLAPFKIFDGGQAAPGLGFTADPDNGLWRNGANDWSLGAGNTELLRFTPNSIVMPATATFSMLGTLAIGALSTAVISPSQISADTNDYAPAGFSGASMLRLSTDASRNITGLAGGSAGRMVLIHNVGGFNMVLTDEDALSAAANRFKLNANLTLLPDASVLLQYDATTAMWRAVGVIASTYMQSLQYAANAAAARTLLEVPSNTEAILDTIIDAKGDLIVGTAADAPARKAVGANGEILMADSSQSDGLIWTSYQPAIDNLLIGGDFATNPWQRGTTFAAWADSAYGPDRWSNRNVGTAAVTALKTADAPSIADAGAYTNSCLHIDCTTADAAVAAGDRFVIRQAIEGYNVAHLGFGQSGTRYVTATFNVKSTKTGIFCAFISNSATNRSYVKEFTVNVTNTWERKTLVFPVDTTGTWLYDSGIGLFFGICLMAGTNFHTTADTWAAGNFNATANQVNALDSTSNDFKLALVELRAGQVALQWQNRSIGAELALCQRYYQTYVNALGRQYGSSPNLYRASGTAGDLYHDNLPLPVIMRNSPTSARIGSWGTSNCSQPTVTAQSAGLLLFSYTNTAGGALQSTASANTGWDATSEL